MALLTEWTMCVLPLSLGVSHLIILFILVLSSDVVERLAFFDHVLLLGFRRSPAPMFNECRS